MAGLFNLQVLERGLAENLTGQLSSLEVRKAFDNLQVRIFDVFTLSLLLVLAYPKIEHFKCLEVD